jgi:hypothetical protein
VTEEAREGKRMGEDRYQQLVEKRDGPGLSDEEADELGRLMAEREGRPYGGSHARPEEHAQEDRADEEARRERAPSSFEIRDQERTEEIEER